MKKLDLNLLRLLVALDQTRHLGRAAEELQMSQSGLSTALARLREQLGDELFVRSPGGMRPTPRASLLADTARTMLCQVQQDIFGSTIFDPKRSETRFKLAMSDVAEVIFLPDLIAHLAIEAPGTTLQISSPGLTPLRERLADGEVDLAIGYLPDLERDAYFRQALYSHTYACIVRKGHPATRSGLTRSVYAGFGHAVVKTAARSTSILEDALEREHIQRKVVLGTPSHLSLPVIVARSDLLATVPKAFAIEASKANAIDVLPLPFQSPAFPVYVYWHRRTHREPGCQWLRTQIKELFDADSNAPVLEPVRKRPAPRRNSRK